MSVQNGDETSGCFLDDVTSENLTDRARGIVDNRPTNTSREFIRDHLTLTRL